MADGDKLVRYITQQVVSYLDTPRRSRRRSRRQRKGTQEVWTSRWFGLVPFAIRFWYKNVRKRRRKA